MVSALRFDDSHSLLWVADSRGYMASYTGKNLQSYTSVKAHDGPVLKILNHKKGVFSLSFDSIRLGTVEGITLCNIRSEELKGLNSMSYTSNTQTELFVGGDAEATGSRIFKIDTINHTISGSFHYPHSIVMMETNYKYVIIGRADGHVDILDPKSTRILESFSCHLSGLSKISVKENSLVTAGFSIKKGQFIPDSFICHIDLKSLTVQKSVAFPAGASAVLHHPTCPGVILASSSMGHFNFIDLHNPTKITIFQADITAYITAIDFASSGCFFAFVDASHSLHLWSRSDVSPNSDFALYNGPLSLPSIVDEPIPPSNQLISSESPLNLIKVPPFITPLLSAWPPNMVFKVGTTPKPIDPEILRSSEVVNGLLIARYNKDKFGARNLANEYKRISKTVTEGVNVPKFISERDDSDEEDGNLSFDSSRPSTKDTKKEDSMTQNIFDVESHTGDVPNAYKQLSIIYSKFGVDDFDFDYYNKTQYSGLEVNSNRSFLNPIIQLYRNIAPIFNVALLSLSHDATEKVNLLMELGYLFDMMHKSHGRHCATANFEIALASLPEIQQLGLNTDNSVVRDDFKQRRMVQIFNRFLLERLARDECHLFEYDCPKLFNEVCGIHAETSIYSNFCSLTHKKDALYYYIDINSLPPPPLVPISLTILNYLEASMNKHAQQQINCENCHLQHPVNASLIIGSNLSPILVLNLNLSNQQLNEIRYLDGWLVREFYYAKSPLGTPVLRQSFIAGVDRQKRYELVGYTAQITNRNNESHMITYSKIREKPGSPGKWFLFNDFLVMEVSEEEVLNVSHWWKKPVTMVYKEFGIGDEFKPEIFKTHLNTSILYKNKLIPGNSNTEIVSKSLDPDEEIVPGTLVALDAEFIELSPAEYEFKSNGTKTLVRPPKLLLAKISVVRGSGPKEGECFIDDYIATNEKIHDYKTEFSGIVEGDLTSGVSDKPLVCLQVAYRKIWLLLNLGCVFVGHWLSGDFRMINIYIPPAQVRDTGLCFYLKKEKRKLGLKFLAHYVLDKEVQKENHDSIEDAITSLSLYKEYLRLKETGQLESVLFKLYLEGQMNGFKVPTAVTLKTSDTTNTNIE
ncbi:hypothetical protein CANINC_005062 [Pichia inconspicua]|uniref:USP domain-containing protein n=1 Tax=Pichia inconspicua TaxID=52247 RepID=A0A4T0WUI2_9ASCO|nr:hypothetical protein CANINC_005062 [[Candida] inconspicua]